jgi:TRAP-type transport system periplasmic protein
MKALLLTLSLFLLSTAHAQELKVGLLAPEGTTWASKMREMAEEVAEATGGRVRFRLYFGGAQGDEHDVLRKIRVGQLQGGIFTGKTLGDINGDVRVMEIPFNFNGDRVKARNALTSMGDFFNTGFKKNQFHNLGFFELGDVYFVAQKTTPSLDSLRGLKIWSWEGDRLVMAMVEALRLVSVPLPITDVLSSLSTGIIEAAYAPPLGVLAFQWNTRVNYLLDLPLSFSIGAFLISERAWGRVSAEHRAIIEKIAARYVAEVNEANHNDNDQALQAMQAMGITFVKFPPSDLEQAQGLREEMVKRLTGNLFSEDALKLLTPHL